MFLCRLYAQPKLVVLLFKQKQKALEEIKELLVKVK